MALKINNQIDASNVVISDGSNAETKIQTITNKLESFGFVTNVATQPYSLSADSKIAYARFNVGKQYANMSVIATSLAIPGTPYNNIYNISVSGVNKDGIVEVEFVGIGFVSAHTFALNFLLFR